jgi:hypothetical protein
VFLFDGRLAALALGIWGRAFFTGYGMASPGHALQLRSCMPAAAVAFLWLSSKWLRQIFWQAALL